MKKLTVAIALTRNFANRFEAKTLLKAFNNKEFNAYLWILNNTAIKFGDEANILGVHSRLPDIVLVREIFSLFKYFLVLTNIFKHQKPNVLILDNNITQNQYIINKLKQGSILTLAGLPFPKSVYIPDYNELRANIHDYVTYLGGYPILLKHRSAGKGNSIYKITSQAELFQILESLAQQDPKGYAVIKKYYLQEFLPLKADYRILVIGGKIVGAMQRIPKEGEFRANFSLGGTTAPAELTPHMATLAQKAIRALNLAFAGVDIVQTQDNRYYILEVNKTPGFEGFSKTYPNKNIPHYFVKYVKEQAQRHRLLS